MTPPSEYRIDPKAGATVILFGLVFALVLGLLLGGLLFWLLGWLAYFFIGWAIQGFLEAMFGAYREEPNYRFSKDHTTLAFGFWPGYLAAAAIYVPLVLLLRGMFKSN